MIVLWRVTQKCNLSCPFCSYDRRVTRPDAASAICWSPVPLKVESARFGLSWRIDD